MIPAYDTEAMNEAYGLSTVNMNEYKRITTLSEDPELIRRVIQNWVQYKNIEFVDLIILTNLLDDENWLNKLVLVKDLSYRNCVVYLGWDKIMRSTSDEDDLSLEEAFKQWEERGVEKIFFLVNSWQKFAKETDEEYLENQHN